MNFKLVSSIIITSMALGLGLLGCQTTEKKTKTSDIEKLSQSPITNEKQLVFAGKRSGEGYFSADGKNLVFQSEREADNPFYQIYVLNFESGQTKRISNGIGKTTCSWFHPSGEKILFSSTHLDKNAIKKQKEELEFRNSGKTRRYSWDYDENYEIFSASSNGGQFRRLTQTKGYDAEGSYSPDGRWIAFASNRNAYNGKLSEEDKKHFENDPAYMMDIYIMKADGTQVRQLTTTKGYDGGPFFSPDGQKIVWRRFSADGATAEIFTMNIDGTDQKQITRLGKMSWAPFYHPSGDYIIFTTNVLGFHNFELYIVDAQGTKDPVRVTDWDGFDGLPVFSPDGTQLVWSRKLKDGQSQIFLGQWDDSLARKLLRLPPQLPKKSEMSASIAKADIEKIVSYLASANLKGRLTGSAEEKIYTERIARLYKELGLKPVNGSYTHSFKFVSGVSLGEKNQFLMKTPNQQFVLDEDWRPLSFSKTGQFEAKDIAFVGFGLVVPADNEIKAYDSYKEIDVKSKWVMIVQDLPDSLSTKERMHYNRYARIQHKVMLARNRGATGVIIVGRPNLSAKAQLVNFKFDSATGAESLPVISVTSHVADQLLAPTSKKMTALLAELNKGEVVSFDLKPTHFTAQVDLIKKESQGLNVLGLLKAPKAKSTLVIGAHGDHLGQGHNQSSLMKSDDKSDIHYGADDNASGVAGVIELAHYFSSLDPRQIKRDIVFSIWSGEEEGNLGSSAFVSDFVKNKSKQFAKVEAYLNMDMIGRYDKSLALQGTGSSNEWAKLLETLAVKTKLSLVPSADPYLPTDSTAFYLAQVPTLNFFTGAHVDYHTPRDTADKIDYDKTEEVIKVVQLFANDLAIKNINLKYNKVEQTGPSHSGSGRQFRIYLGTIPDYTNKDVKGVAISGVIKGGPAEAAGLKGGDVIIQFSENKIENIYDYVYTLEAVKPNNKTRIVVLRDGKSVELEITPKTRE